MSAMGRVANVHKGGEIDQTLVQIEKRHVAAGAAAEPHGGQSWTRIVHQAIHSFSFLRGDDVFQEAAVLAHFGNGLALQKQRSGGAHLDAFAAAGAGVGFAPGLAEVGDDGRVAAAAGTSQV